MYTYMYTWDVSVYKVLLPVNLSAMLFQRDFRQLVMLKVGLLTPSRLLKSRYTAKILAESKMNSINVFIVLEMFLHCITQTQ